MLDEKLYALIRKYEIEMDIGRRTSLAPKARRWTRLKQAVGFLRVAKLLNGALENVQDDGVALCGERGRLLEVIWWLLLPRNRRKIRFLVTDIRKESEFHGREVLEIYELGRHLVGTAVVAAWHPGWRANLMGRRFEGVIIDLYSVIHENHLEQFFEESLRHDPYADIFIARCFCHEVEDSRQRRAWHQRLIAHYLRARDFLGVEKEIRAYAEAGYEDAANYAAFWQELQKLLSDIKRQLVKRNERDVFVYWLDQLEKEDFLSMRWAGNLETGRFFCRAYTAMVHTTAIFRAIFTGKNVKSGRLAEYGKLDPENAELLCRAREERIIRVFSGASNGHFDPAFVHDCCKNLTSFAPATIGFWYALDTVLSSPKPCVCFLHCMETHNPFNSAESDIWQFDSWSKKIFFNNQKMDYTKSAAKSRAYLDKQLEWYHGFLPSNAIAIYMSDHGNEQNLTEQNVNMPFKIIGQGIAPGSEGRLFSYKDMHKLIDCMLSSNAIDGCFADYAIIDQIDPYNKAFGHNIREEGWNHFLYERKKLGKNFLKKYIQATKVVTAEGEYYTINILGEEAYYRDNECKSNLVDNPAYRGRIAELREMAGKFYNPWKEKRQVAIDFYEYLGIREQDIVDQCF